MTDPRPDRVLAGYERALGLISCYIYGYLEGDDELIALFEDLVAEAGVDHRTLSDTIFGAALLWHQTDDRDLVPELEEHALLAARIDGMEDQ